MAELVAAGSAAQVGDRTPWGKYSAVTFLTSALGTGSASEWIATGLSEIKGILGYAPSGTAPFASTAVFGINLQGTGGSAEGGSLGVRVGGAGDNALYVTVFGTP